uniref:Uncharacterized protein n=1 Tax=Solanum tuberosum TaxID=4113 RepID=M1CW89_SOLTU
MENMLQLESVPCNPFHHLVPWSKLIKILHYFPVITSVHIPKGNLHESSKHMSELTMENMLQLESVPCNPFHHLVPWSKLIKILHYFPVSLVITSVHNPKRNLHESSKHMSELTMENMLQLESVPCNNPFIILYRGRNSSRYFTIFQS